MKAREAALLVMDLLTPAHDLSDEETGELLVGSELLARYVLADEADPDLATAVSTEHLAELAIQHRRYLLLLKLIHADDDAGRALLERSLDAEIERREQHVVRLQ